MKCPYCGSENIEVGLAVAEDCNIARVGLKYKRGILCGVAQIYSDLCLDCKAIVKSYIKEDTDKKWLK